MQNKIKCQNCGNTVNILDSLYLRLKKIKVQIPISNEEDDTANIYGQSWFTSGNDNRYTVILFTLRLRYRIWKKLTYPYRYIKHLIQRRIKNNDRK